MSIALALVLHAHQPAGNFDEVVERAYQSAYRPFVEAAAARPWLRLNLHFSGWLLEWLEQRHPEYIARLREAVASGRWEVLGGGYFEPILPAIPAQHQQEQLRRLSDALERLLGVRPQGAWLAERVWEPGLASVLACGGARYTLLDDSHFEAAGLKSEALHGYWLTEDQGETLAVAPSNFFLRQALPFRPADEGLAYLERVAAQSPGSLLTMGDDLEKFGSWPHTARHVYAEGWLTRFLDGLEARRAQIETVRLSDYLGQHPPRGLVYLPTASYPELMQWAGNASWRSFLTKYPEANQLYRTGWDLYRRLAACDPKAPEAAKAHEHLLAAECNDVYWHGWFGGLYSPHLRNLAYTQLLAADGLIEALASARSPRRFDLLGDGRETIELRSRELRLLLRPSDGGSVLELDHCATNANLINSIQRRPEAYHEELRRHASVNPAHLPGEPVTQENLESLIQYDAFAPSAARLYLCAPTNRLDQFLGGALEPDATAAGSDYEVERAEGGEVELAQDGIRKRITVKGNTVRVAVEIDPQRLAGRQALLEMVFNLLAPDADDRRLRHEGGDRRLDFSGELAGEMLELVDGWRKLAIRLRAPGAGQWWVRPLYTVSQGETGLEAVYQGSALAARWPPGIGRIAVEVKIFQY